MNRTSEKLGKAVRELDIISSDLKRDPTCADRTGLVLRVDSVANDLAKLLEAWAEVFGEVPHNHTP